MRKRVSQSGFSIIELLITIFIFTVLSTAVYTLFRSISSSNRVLSASIAAQDEARKVLKPLVGEVRDATSSSTGTYAIQTATNTEFTFYSNVDSDTLVERIRYFLSGTTLKKGVIKPSGSPLAYDSGSETVTEVIHHIANGATPIFTYYDENYTGTQAALSTPILISSVRLVKIYVIIDPLGASSPSPTIMTTQVQLRNLKDN
jgi:prepilin-type N-terminal cleavage/methylation domain-containing protein